MKYVLKIAQVIVGVLFIFSGLVKANDPQGLSYKMKEFFEIWNQELQSGSFFLKTALINFFQFWHDHSLSLSVFMIAFEIIAGVALLAAWRIKLFSWLLLLLTIFFTFLTAYAYYSGKFTNCGCFGDCLPITPKVSFLKDLVLTVIIIFLFVNRRNMRPSVAEHVGFAWVVGATVFSFGLQWYVLNYLPIVDCLPFRKGNNIIEKREMPADAVPDSTVITFVYEKDGKQIEFTADKFPADFKTPPYRFIKRYDKLVRKGKNNEPPIKGFYLRTASGFDSTDLVLAEPKAYLLFCENFSTPVRDWQNDFQKLKTVADQRAVPVYIITASRNEANSALASTSFASIPVFECDFTAIRTAARTNPCLYLIEKGIVINKWSYKRIGAATDQLISGK